MPVETVLCFDRDRTVSVNPDPQRDAVPISWVKSWAHHPDYSSIDVWATGNQRLKAEAALPGIQEALELATNHSDTSVPKTQRDRQSHAAETARREGLRLIKCCYDRDDAPTPEQWIVIDDVDLTDLVEEGWEAWFPWDFYQAVSEHGEPLPQPDVTEFPNSPLSDDATEYIPSASILE